MKVRTGWSTKLYITNKIYSYDCRFCSWPWQRFVLGRPTVPCLWPETHHRWFQPIAESG